MELKFQPYSNPSQRITPQICDKHCMALASEVQEQNFCISKQACDTGSLSTSSGTLIVAGHLQVGERVLTPCRVTLVELLPLVRADRKLGLWKGYRLNLSNRRRNRRVRGEGL